MKDSIYLLLTACASALLAWAFFYFLGELSLHVFAVSALLVTIGENLRLRRKVRILESKQATDQPAESANGTKPDCEGV